jgi:hypothetical protein
MGWVYRELKTVSSVVTGISNFKTFFPGNIKSNFFCETHSKMNIAHFATTSVYVTFAEIL